MDNYCRAFVHQYANYNNYVVMALHFRVCIVLEPYQAKKVVERGGSSLTFFYV